MNNIFVTRPYLPPIDEYVKELKDIWNNRWLTNMGPKHDELVEELKKYLQVDKMDLLVNGHMALELAIQAMNLKGEVITTPFTFASTTHAIVRNGLKPVFCDIRADDYTIDTDKIENLITDKTTAIIPVHVYGNICNVNEIKRIANKYELKVIYDAAHAFGEKYNGEGVGNFGDASIFSFHATKVFNTVEGGAVSYTDDEMGMRLYELKNFGIHSEEDVPAVGANAKMNEFCAAMGLCNLRHIDQCIDERRQITEQYNELLSDIDGIQLNKEVEGLERNYAYYPIVIDETVFGASREEVFCALASNGINARKYFYPLTSHFSAFRDSYQLYDTPVALHISKRVLTLPLYTGLTFDDIERICNVIKMCHK